LKSKNWELQKAALWRQLICLLLAKEKETETRLSYSHIGLRNGTPLLHFVSST